MIFSFSKTYDDQSSDLFLWPSMIVHVCNAQKIDYDKEIIMGVKNVSHWAIRLHFLLWSVSIEWFK